MAMAITMRMLAQIFFFSTEVTQGPLSSVHYTHIKRSPKSRCAICSGCEDTAKMSPRSRGTCPPDLAGDLSLLSPPLSVLFSKTDLGKRSPGKQPRGWYGGHLGSICGLWTNVKHLCCAQKPPNRSSGEAKTQKPTKSTVARKRRKF